jgi:hypothetical protein
MLQAPSRPDRADSDDRLRRLFWRAFPPHLLPLVLCVMVFNPSYFRFDREVVDQLLRARTPREWEEELRDFSRDFRNRSWLRGRLRLRLSTRRLRVLMAGGNGPARQTHDRTTTA